MRFYKKRMLFIEYANPFISPYRVLRSVATSSRVCGRLRVIVSGRDRPDRPAAMLSTPNTRRGSGDHASRRSRTKGANIPPIRADMEATPIPAFLVFEKKKKKDNYLKQKIDKIKVALICMTLLITSNFQNSPT